MSRAGYGRDKVGCSVEIHGRERKGFKLYFFSNATVKSCNFLRSKVK